MTRKNVYITVAIVLVAAAVVAANLYFKKDKGLIVTTEAIKIGSRILLLSPHPGQVKAEVNSMPRGEENSPGGVALAKKIHDMLFTDSVEEVTHV